LECTVFVGAGIHVLLKDGLLKDVLLKGLGMQRREWIQSGLQWAGAAAAGCSFSGGLLAASPTTPRLLVVFLRGGYDANSLLVPTASSFYREVRPNIAIPFVKDAGKDLPKDGMKDGTKDVTKDATKEAPKSAFALNNDWALHPALETSVLPLVMQKQAVFVPFAGTDDLTRSHFETQDTIELGQGTKGKRDFGSGFLNRLAAVIQSPAASANAGRDAIAFTDQLPLVLRGSLSVANLSLKNEPKAADAKLRQALTDMYRNHPLQAKVAESFDVRAEAAKDVTMPSADVAGNTMATTAAAPGMAGEQISANRNAINAKGFELEARRIARLMRERYALGFVDVGGWDTHVGQGAATGYLASRFEELGRGLAGFANEMGDAAWRNTTVVVLSEFGRTMRENGNRGTDHGHASVYWVLGGNLGSGAANRVVGEQQAIEARTLFQNRDMPVLNDHRAVLGGLLARQFALSAAQVQTVFPGSLPRDLGLL
jgi:uncharacterized protein (DUF1501 family)